MADINQIRLPNNSLYDIKDKTIRDEVKYKIYNSVTDLGLTVGSATIAGAWAAMPVNSMLVCHCNNFASTEFTGATPYGVVEMVKADGNLRGSIRLYGRDPTDSSQGDWRMGINASGEPFGVWVYAIPNMSGYMQFTATAPSTINQNYTVTLSLLKGRQFVGVWSEAFGTVWVRDGFWTYHYVSPRDDYWHAGIAYNWQSSTGTLTYVMLDRGDSRSAASCTPSFIFW